MFLDIRCYPPPSFRVAVIFFLELYMNIYINITIGYMSLNIRCTPPPSFPGCRDFFLERSIKALFYFLFKIRK